MPDAPPSVLPAPRTLVRAGDDVAVPRRVEVVVGVHTDSAACLLLVEVLAAVGATAEIVETPGNASLRFRLGPDHDGAAPDVSEGYAVVVDARRAEVMLAGRDPAGQYYAVQTLRQLLRRRDRGWVVTGWRVSDAPRMRVRGTVEGFRGAPWNHQERLDQLRFLGRVKANTYICAPKGDPFHRDRWRENYPATKLAELDELVATARAHHVRLTFALAPGNTINCASAADRRALVAKLETMHALGIRSFAIAWDDVEPELRRAEDERDGSSPGANLGHAQVELLNHVHERFVARHEDVHPLLTVPTEYADLADTPYKQAWRERLHPEIVVLWTGSSVMPPGIGVDEARRASALFGRPVLVWDNYPANDVEATAGRLLLAPFDHRGPGLSDEVAGLVGNPMNQAYASMLPLASTADFAWDDRGWDRGRSAGLAVREVAGDNPAVTDAVELLVDLCHAAPRLDGELWLPPAPRTAGLLASFWSRWRGGEAEALEALESLRSIVAMLQRVPELIRHGARRGFVADVDRHLDALGFWAEALAQAATALAALRAQDDATALAARDRMLALAGRAVRVPSQPGRNAFAGPVRIGDGVLDGFVDTVSAEVSDHAQDAEGEEPSSGVPTGEPSD